MQLQTENMSISKFLPGCRQNMKETRNTKRSEEWAKLSLQDVLALPTLALQGNLEKIFSFSLAVSQRSTGLTQCDICFYWVKKKKSERGPPLQDAVLKTSHSLQTKLIHKVKRAGEQAYCSLSHWGICRNTEVRGAADLVCSGLSQRGLLLLPFHKQPKNCFAGCGKWWSQLTKHRERYKSESGMRPGLYLSD